MFFNNSLKFFVPKILIFSVGYYYIACIECPLNIPYAYFNGAYCCHYSKEKAAYDVRGIQDTNCDGSDISLTSECCEKDAFIQCPGGGTCTTPAFDTSEPCPEDFANPYFYGLYCCKTAVEKASFEYRATGTACQGGALSLNSLCCLNDEFKLCPNPPCTGAPYWSLTWHAEGNDDPTDPNFSRILRVPTGKGITMGKGYDLANTLPPEAVELLTSIGLGGDYVDRIALGAELSGATATQYLIDNSLTSFTLTHTQQWNLFTTMRDSFIVTAKSVYTNFETKNTSIQGLIIDLMWTGDFTSSTRTFLDTPVNGNDVTALKDIMSDTSRWTSVSTDRFNRRKLYMENAVAAL